MLLVSRRTALLASPSRSIMRAAGHASSTAAARNVGAKIMHASMGVVVEKMRASVGNIGKPYLTDKAAALLGLKAGEYMPNRPLNL